MPIPVAIAGLVSSAGRAAAMGLRSLSLGRLMGRFGSRNSRGSAIKTRVEIDAKDVKLNVPKDNKKLRREITRRLSKVLKIGMGKRTRGVWDNYVQKAVNKHVRDYANFVQYGESDSLERYRSSTSLSSLESLLDKEMTIIANELANEIVKKK